MYDVMTAVTDVLQVVMVERDVRVIDVLWSNVTLVMHDHTQLLATSLAHAAVYRLAL